MEFEKIKEIVADIFNYDYHLINKETRMNEDLKMNSITVIELMVALEETFDVEINEGEFIDTQTVGELVNYTEK